jgi:hypothetical protein
MKAIDIVNFLIGVKNTVFQTLTETSESVTSTFNSYKYKGETDMSEPAVKLKVRTAWFLVSFKESVTNFKNSLVKETAV